MPVLRGYAKCFIQKIKVMSIVTEVRKSAQFSKEKPFAVVRFRKGGQNTSKFAIGSLNDATSYSLTYNLQLIYPDATNEDGEFSAKEAFKLFKDEMKVGSEENVNCFDVDIREISEFKAVKIKATGRIMQIMRPACYGGKDDAIRIARASLERQLREKTFIPVNPDNENDESDENDDD